MNTLYKFLFPGEERPQTVSLAILAMRLIFGILIMNHGYMKIANFGALEQAFPDPLGVGSQLSLLLAIFAEFLCGLAFTIGLLYRIVLIPLIFTMLVILLVVHASDPLSAKELALLYLAIFCISYIMGPGRFAVDQLIRNMLFKK